MCRLVARDAGNIHADGLPDGGNHLAVWVVGHCSQWPEAHVDFSLEKNAPNLRYSWKMAVYVP